MSLKLRSHPFLFVAVTGIAVSGIGAYVYHEQSRPAVLEMYIFSLKGGEALFVRTPEDKRILINGGANGDIIREITSILPFYSRRIDAVIATKDDANHVTGLIDIISRYDVGSVFVPATRMNSIGLASTTDPAYQAFVNVVTSKNIPVREVKAEDSIPLGLKTSLKALFPADPNKFMYSKASAPEVLPQISYGSTAVYFLGDSTPKIQKYVASSTSIASSDSNALIIPQSISPGNITHELLGAINPSSIIYSQSPKNTSGKAKSSTKTSRKIPIDSVSAIENKFNLKEGNVKIISDGKKLEIKNAP